MQYVQHTDECKLGGNIAIRGSTIWIYRMTSEEGHQWLPSIALPSLLKHCRRLVGVNSNDLTIVKRDARIDHSCMVVCTMHITPGLVFVVLCACGNGRGYFT